MDHQLDRLHRLRFSLMEQISIKSRELTALVLKMKTLEEISKDMEVFSSKEQQPELTTQHKEFAEKLVEKLQIPIEPPITMP